MCQPFNYVIVRALKIEKIGCHSSHKESRFPTRLVETSCLLTRIRLEFLTDSLKNSGAVFEIQSGNVLVHKTNSIIFWNFSTSPVLKG